MKKAAFIFLLFFVFGCKKKFTCSCQSVVRGTVIIDEKEFTVKEKDKKLAYHKCVNEYANSDSASGVIECEVK